LRAEVAGTGSVARQAQARGAKDGFVALNSGLQLTAPGC